MRVGDRIQARKYVWLNGDIWSAGEYAYIEDYAVNRDDFQLRREKDKALYFMPAHIISRYFLACSSHCLSHGGADGVAATLSGGLVSKAPHPMCWKAGDTIRFNGNSFSPYFTRGKTYILEKDAHNIGQDYRAPIKADNGINIVVILSNSVWEFFSAGPSVATLPAAASILSRPFRAGDIVVAKRDILASWNPAVVGVFQGRSHRVASAGNFTLQIACDDSGHCGYYDTNDFELATSSLEEIKKSEVAKASGCTCEADHEWKEHEGLFEKFRYCVKCDTKRRD